MSYSAHVASIRILFIMLLTSSLFTTSCSKTEDVRLVLCRDITMALLNSAEDFVLHEQNTIMNGYEDLEIKLVYSTLQTDGITLDQQSSCFYAYVEDDIGMETFNTPTSAYATYPGKVIFNKQELMPNQLAPMIEQIMLKQGREVINKIKDNINQQVKSQ